MGRRWHIAVAAVVSALMVLGGCGGSDGATVNYRDTATYQQETRELKEQRADERRVREEVEADTQHRERQSEEERAAIPEDHPGPATERSGSGRPLVEKIARESREVCSAFSLEQMATEYGVPADIGSVAAAFSDGYREDVQIVAEGGCLEGLAE